MMIRQTVFLAVSLVACLGASCDSQISTGGAAKATASTAPTTSPPLSTGGSPIGTWKLESGRVPDGEVPIVEGWDITLQITDGRIAGRSACNSYGGSVKIKGTSFDVRGLGGTQIGCEGAVALAEERYVDAIKGADSIGRRGDRLEITGEGIRLVFRQLAPPPTAKLVGTTWHLESFFESSGDDHTVTSAAPAKLRLMPDGTFIASTGCRPLEGKWIENVGEILFNEMHAKGRCSEDLTLQDNHVVGVLGDGFTAQVEREVGGPQLTIVNSRGGAGLLYRAD